MTATAETSVTKYRASREARYVHRAAAARLAGWSVEHLYDGDWSQVAWRATAGCARSILADDGTVVVRCGPSADGSNRAYFAGVRRCGSVWLCPVCTATIRAHRADEVGAIADAHVAAGGRIQMLTLTVRHKHDTPLDLLYESIRGAYTGLQQSARWRRYRHFMAGQTVTVESTLGVNGFHLHLHVLLLWKGCGNGQHHRRTRSMNRWGPTAWAERVERRLGARPSDERGWHLLDLKASSARYVAKITGEVTRGDYKSRDALTVMLEGVVKGDGQSCARYNEWATVMAGKRMIRFSPGLRDLYIPEVPELDDLEVVNTDRAGAPDLGQLSREDYLGLHAATKSKPLPSAPAFLAAVEDEGWHPLLMPVASGPPIDVAQVSVHVRLARGLGRQEGLPGPVQAVVAPPDEPVWQRSAAVTEFLERCARSGVS